MRLKVQSKPSSSEVMIKSLSISGFFFNKIAKTQAAKNSRNTKLKANFCWELNIFGSKLNIFAPKLNVSELLLSKKLQNFPKTPIFPLETQGFRPQNSSYRNSRAHSSSDLC